MTTKQKQRQLQFLGYYGGKIDGKWGDRSKSATSAFQEDFGLTVDGTFGPATKAKTIETVKFVQKMIGAEVDGIVGDETIDLTKAYQKKNCLQVDGIAGERTRAKMGMKIVDFWDTIKYFKKSDFACKCGGKYCKGFPVDIDHNVVRLLERAREYFGKPCIVTSGVRCTTHNKNVGGVSNSRHKQGKAADFTIQGVSGTTLYNWVKKQPEKRYTYIIEGAYVHVDVY